MATDKWKVGLFAGGLVIITFIIASAFSGSEKPKQNPVPKAQYKPAPAPSQAALSKPAPVLAEQSRPAPERKTSTAPAQERRETRPPEPRETVSTFTAAEPPTRTEPAKAIQEQSDSTPPPLVQAKAITPPPARKELPNIVQSFGDLRVELAPLRIIEGKEYQLNMNLANQSQSSLWVAIARDAGRGPRGSITSPQGVEFEPQNKISGIEADIGKKGRFAEATEIKPGSSIVASVSFKGRNVKALSAGQCDLQLELLVGNNGATGECRPQNLVTKIESQ